MKDAILALADGTVFRGRALGFEGETAGEVVFNTAMTGYQEILTDPSYKGQMVTMTCPHIGNYGVTRQDVESRRVNADGFIVKASSRRPSNWRSEQALDEYLREAKVVGIEGLDTRALTRHLRDAGSQTGVISHLDLDPSRAVEKARRAPTIVGRDLVAEVTCAESYEWTEGSGAWGPDERARPHDGRRFKVVVYDFGLKRNILRRLVDVGCAVTVVPASTPADAVLALRPDGVLLSNGPGDPEGVPYAIRAVQMLLERSPTLPMLGICLGHQILGLATGLQTFKLKFGHHAANHPVLNMRTRQVEITSQNHNFSVRVPDAARSADRPGMETHYGRLSVTHRSLNDDSVEGLACLDRPVFSVQYHPEASPGPHDASYLFQEFIRLMENAHA